MVWHSWALALPVQNLKWSLPTVRNRKQRDMCLIMSYQHFHEPCSHYGSPLRKQGNHFILILLGKKTEAQVQVHDVPDHTFGLPVIRQVFTWGQVCARHPSEVNETKSSLSWNLLSSRRESHTRRELESRKPTSSPVPFTIASCLLPKLWAGI